MIPLPNVFSQRDSRWSKNKLGSSSLTLGDAGCLVTVLSMVCRYFGKDTDPDKLNTSLVGVNGFQDQNLYKWYEGITKIYPDIAITKKKDTPFPLDSRHWTEIDAELRANRPVIIEVDFIPDTSKLDMHFVLIVDGANGEYSVADPWYGDISNLRRYGEPKATIQQYIFHEGAVPQAQTELQKLQEKYNELWRGTEDLKRQYETDKKAWSVWEEQKRDILKENEGLKAAKGKWEDFFDELWGKLNPLGKEKSTANALAEIAEMIMREDQDRDCMDEKKVLVKNHTDFVSSIKKKIKSNAVEDSDVLAALDSALQGVAPQPVPDTPVPEPDIPDKPDPMGALQTLIDFIKRLFGWR
jgi:hypothetical protein